MEISLLQVSSRLFVETFVNLYSRGPVIIRSINKNNISSRTSRVVVVNQIRSTSPCLADHSFGRASNLVRSISVVHSRRVSSSACGPYQQGVLYTQSCITHRQSELLVDLLVILSSGHIAKVPQARIVHNSNLVPPRGRRSRRVSSRIRLS